MSELDPIEGVGLDAYLRGRARLEFAPDSMGTVVGELGLPDAEVWRRVDYAWRARMEEHPQLAYVAKQFLGDFARELRGERPLRDDEDEADEAGEPGSEIEAGDASVQPRLQVAPQIPSFMHASAPAPGPAQTAFVGSLGASPLAAPPRYHASFQRLGEQPVVAPPPPPPMPPPNLVAATTSTSGDDDVVGETAHMSVPQGLAAAAAAREAMPFANRTSGSPPPTDSAEHPLYERKAALNSTVGLTSEDEAKLRALVSTPFGAASPQKKKELLATVAIDDDVVGETAHMSVPEGLAAAAAAREALPFAKGAPGELPPAPPPVATAELSPQKRNPAMASTVGLTGDDEAKLRALLSTPFDERAPKKREFLSTVAVLDHDVDAVGETARMSVPEGLAAAAAAREALPFPKNAEPHRPAPEPVLPPIGQLVEMQAALARAGDRDALLASHGYSSEAWQSILRRYGALMQSDPNLRLRYESLLAQASAR